jgi:hypothetical protein
MIRVVRQADIFWADMLKQVDWYRDPSSKKPLQVNDVNLVSQMFRPIRYRPRAKAFHLTMPPSGIASCAVAFNEWINCQTRKNSQKLLPMAFLGVSEELENSVVNNISVMRHHRPSAESRSCNASNSSAVWPLPSKQRSNLRPSSASHSGSSCSDRPRK